LKLAKAPNDTYCCDLCTKAVKKGAPLLGCRKCNYDICSKCSPSQAQDEAEESNDNTSDDEDETDSSSEDEGEEERKLIICVRSDLGMTMGKVAAQVGHAVHHAIGNSRWRELRAWESIGAKKVSVKVESEEQLLELRRKARQAGLVAERIRDAGHTEVAPGTTTVLAIGPATSKEIDPITGHLRPLPDPVQAVQREAKKLREKAERLQKELDDEKKKKKQLLQLLRVGRFCD